MKKNRVRGSQWSDEIIKSPKKKEFIHLSSVFYLFFVVLQVTDLHFLCRYISSMDYYEEELRSTL